MKKLHFLALWLLPVAMVAQVPEISPVPQNVKWGEKVFENNNGFNVVGGETADQDAVKALKGGITSDVNGTKLVIGEKGDKAVKAYKKLIPAKSEGYYLKVSQDEVVIAGNDESGTFYGVQTFLQIRKKRNVMGCEITDWPSVSCRGVIEGFYGNPWSQKDRLRQFDFYGQNKMNTYVYGPKDDPYHRAHWRDPYPEKEAAQLKELVERAKSNKVQFVWACHPGGDIKWNKNDSDAIVNKLSHMYDLGVRTFAIFFDDIGGEGARGEKQAGLLNYITDNFIHKHKDANPLIICPTVYNKAWAGSEYLPALGKSLYPEVRIMWTGNSVVDMIQKEDMEWINGQIGRKAFIWLNYPVSDYCVDYLLMGKTYGNGLDIADMVSGFCSNPMEYAEASKVSLFSIADYTWNMPVYNAESSWEKAIKSIMPTSTEAFRYFCQNNINLPKNGHGFYRDGESEEFRKATDKKAEFMKMNMMADILLADSINQPEMINEITPWLKSMKLLAQRGMIGLTMQEEKEKAKQNGENGEKYDALSSVAQQMEKEQKDITSRKFPGSIKVAHPVVGGSVIKPFVDELTKSDKGEEASKE